MEYQELNWFDIRLVFPAQFAIMPHPNPLGRMRTSVINIPPELRENKLAVRACCHSICGRHRSQTLFGRSKMAPHASLFSMACFYKEAPFQKMSNFRLFALYINHVFYDRRITFCLMVFERRKKAAKQEVSRRARNKGSIIFSKYGWRKSPVLVSHWPILWNWHSNIIQDENR